MSVAGFLFEPGRRGNEPLTPTGGARRSLTRRSAPFDGLGSRGERVHGALAATGS